MIDRRQRRLGLITPLTHTHTRASTSPHITTNHIRHNTPSQQQHGYHIRNGARNGAKIESTTSRATASSAMTSSTKTSSPRCHPRMPSRLLFQSIFLGYNFLARLNILPSRHHCRDVAGLWTEAHACTGTRAQTLV